MTLIIDLPEEQETALKGKAQAQGVSAEEYARQVLKRELQTEPPFAVRIREIWNGMPAEVRAKLPEDGASQIDHYVYGLPKRNE